MWRTIHHVLSLILKILIPFVADAEDPFGNLLSLFISALSLSLSLSLSGPLHASSTPAAKGNPKTKGAEYKKAGSAWEPIWLADESPAHWVVQRNPLKTKTLSRSPLTKYLSPSSSSFSNSKPTTTTTTTYVSLTKKTSTQTHLLSLSLSLEILSQKHLLHSTNTTIFLQWLTINNPLVFFWAKFRQISICTKDFSWKKKDPKIRQISKKFSPKCQPTVDFQILANKFIW